MSGAAPARPGGMGRALRVSAGTLTSRLLGVVRDQVFAALIGANRFSDAFVVAYRVPNLLRDLFAEGALSAAFVPAFARAGQEGGREGAGRLAGTVVGLVLVVVGGLSALGMLLAGPLVRVMAPGLPEQALAAALARVMMPFLTIVSLSATAMGMLNAHSRFTAAALAPALFNVGALAVGLSLWAADVPPERAVIGWALGVLLGGALQLGVQLPPLRALGYRPWPRLSRARLDDPAVRRMFGGMGAAVIGLSATQVNVVVNTFFASQEVGANTWLQCAFRLIMLPLGVFGVAIATVAGAEVAQRAAERDLPAVRRTLGASLRLLAFLTVPSAVGLLVLARPIIALLYQHGRFGPADTEATAGALLGYALGLYAYAGVKVLAPVFYALGSARVPALASWAAMAANVAVNALLHPWLGYRGVALGTALAAAANFALLLAAWRRLHGGTPDARLLAQLGRVLLASGAMAAVAWAAHHGLAVALGSAGGVGARLVLVFGPIAAGVAAYAGAAHALRIAELAELVAMLRRRRGGAAQA
jgi:putative peptidoglycan lipid II flippase